MAYTEAGGWMEKYKKGKHDFPVKKPTKVNGTLAFKVLVFSLLGKQERFNFTSFLLCN